ncbi:24289_t:CDS:2 [Gigaspora rosea]|nr:24289_t:CDS:2 [Gigaspora rosea]
MTGGWGSVPTPDSECGAEKNDCPKSCGNISFRQITQQYKF